MTEMPVSHAHVCIQTLLWNRLAKCYTPSASRGQTCMQPTKDVFNISIAQVAESEDEVRELQGRVVQLGERVVKMQTLVKVCASVFGVYRIPAQTGTNQLAVLCGMPQPVYARKTGRKCAAHMQTVPAEVDGIAKAQSWSCQLWGLQRLRPFIRLQPRVHHMGP